MALDLADVMAAMGTALAEIDGLRVSDYPADSVAPPHAIVSLPETVEYDTVAGRGADRVVIPVLVVVGKVSERAARTTLARYVSGAGEWSIKTALEAATVGQTARVTNARIDVVTIGAVDYLGASFDVEVYD
jgi:hypothetical protein